MIDWIYNLGLSTYEQWAAHFIVGCCVMAFAILSEKQRIAIVIVLAFGKELLDQYKYGGFDWLDILFTLLSIAFYFFAKFLHDVIDKTFSSTRET